MQQFDYCTDCWFADSYTDGSYDVLKASYDEDGACEYAESAGDEVGQYVRDLADRQDYEMDLAERQDYYMELVREMNGSGDYFDDYYTTSALHRELTEFGL